MEFLICLLLAAIFTGGRVTSDIVHGVKGTTPPHLEKARLRAQRDADRRAAASGRQSRPGDDRPSLLDVLRVYKGDVWQDAIDHHNRTRAEKRAKRTGIPQVVTTDTEPAQRKPADDTIVPAVTEENPLPGNATDPAAVDAQRQTRKPDDSAGGTPQQVDYRRLCRRCAKNRRYGFSELCRSCDDEEARLYWEALHPPIPPSATPTEENPMPDTYEPAPRFPEELAATRQRAEQHDRAAATAANPTGEVANYETAMAELDALEQVQQSHLDEALNAQRAAQALKESVSNTQATYRPAAEAGANIHESLNALNLDTETVAQTGTVVDSMPPNRADEMFTQIEQMEVDVNQQVANAESALQATRNARQVIVEKYGDAHVTVQTDLAGDPRFLAGTGAPAA